MRILFFILLFALLMAVTEACCKTCPRTSDSSAGLSRHRSSCAAYKQSKKDSTARRHSLFAQKASRVSQPSCKYSIASHTTIPSPAPILACPVTPPPPPVTETGRPRRNYRLPARFEDVLPEPPAPVVVAQEPVIGPRRVILHVRDTMRSVCNRFGIFREYPHCPSYDPDSLLQPDDLANIPPPSTPPVDDTPTFSPPAPWPFRNMSIYRLMHWANSGSNSKSEAEVTRLVADVITSDDFRASDLAGFNAHRENKVLDDSDKAKPGDAPWVKDGWIETEVDIEIPAGVRNAPSRKFSVPGRHRRSIVQAIKAAFTEVTALQLHTIQAVSYHRFWDRRAGL
ncbi:hypothetical protein B0H14DRAFT_3556098 [Mycena olivaceomarginata]|nr:hypothetical protein B0H14DRAFT_3556098 [Mycena olivaceomarginata]